MALTKPDIGTFTIGGIEATVDEVQWSETTELSAAPDATKSVAPPRQYKRLKMTITYRKPGADEAEVAWLDVRV